MLRDAPGGFGGGGYRGEQMMLAAGNVAAAGPMAAKAAVDGEQERDCRRRSGR